MRFLILFLANLLLVVNGDILLKLKKIKKREAQNSVQPCGVTQVTSGCPYSNQNAAIPYPYPVYGNGGVNFGIPNNFQNYLPNPQQIPVPYTQNGNYQLQNYAKGNSQNLGCYQSCFGPHISKCCPGSPTNTCGQCLFNYSGTCKKNCQQSNNNYYNGNNNNGFGYQYFGY